MPSFRLSPPSPTTLKLPIKTIDFSKKEEKKLHDEIVRTQKELIEIQEELDENSKNSRVLIPLQRKFENAKNNLNTLLEELFNVGDEDFIIPLISKIYEAH